MKTEFANNTTDVEQWTFQQIAVLNNDALLSNNVFLLSISLSVVENFKTLRISLVVVENSIFNNEAFLAKFTINAFFISLAVVWNWVYSQIFSTQLKILKISFLCGSWEQSFFFNVKMASFWQRWFSFCHCLTNCCFKQRSFFCQNLRTMLF